MRRGIRSGLTAALVASVVAAVRPGDAQVSSDAALIAQLIFQEKQAVAELTQIIQALQGQTQLLAQFLKGQPQGELDYVGSLLQGTERNYTALIGNLQSIGYTISAVNGDYETTFPNTTALQAMRSSEFPTVQSGYENEILASSEIAARSQASLSDTEVLTDLAKQILSYVGTTDSAVGQLQLILQMLGVVQTQMTVLVQNLATTGRAMADTGAAAASERQLATERIHRNRADYTSRGAPVNVPSEMP
jgi:conjugal transfer/entry exclusion protein